MTALVVRLLFPVALVVGAALVAKGYAQIGDGFSGGAAAGLGALLPYVALERREAARLVGARAAWKLVGGGLVLALAVALAPVFTGRAPVWHLPRPDAHVARFGVLELHTALLFDLGVAALVYGALVATFDRLFPPQDEAAEREDRA